MQRRILHLAKNAVCTCDSRLKSRGENSKQRLKQKKTNLQTPMQQNQHALKNRANFHERVSLTDRHLIDASPCSRSRVCAAHSLDEFGGVHFFLVAVVFLAVCVCNCNCPLALVSFPPCHGSHWKGEDGKNASCTRAGCTC